MYNEVNLSEEDRNKELELLYNSYQMYEKSKKECREKMSAATDNFGNPIHSKESIDKNIQLIETMQQDIKDEYLQLGGEEAKLTAKRTGRRKKTDREALRKLMEKAEKEDIEKNKVEEVETGEPIIHIDPVVETVRTETVTEAREEYKVPEIDYGIKIDKNTNGVNRTQYDVVPLPSGGRCYKHKMDKVPVAYLTAYDENLIVSPNLYQDGTFLDQILKNKIMNSKFDPEDMLPGDRDAIILWLRATGYGTDFPVTAKDNETGKEFEAVVDLREIKYKKFDLKADEDGYFDYVLPITKDKVKFKFLTQRDVKYLGELENDEIKAVKASKIENMVDSLELMVTAETNLDTQMKVKMNEAIKTLNSFKENLSDDDTPYTTAITNRLVRSIMSVNDITDRKYINEYVENMNVRDSSALRRYITDNEPGLDFNITIEKPESLGGGSMKIFLTLDQYIFLNIV